MTQIPAGWYPDPDPDAPEPRGQRYWDGRLWTEHVQPAAGAPAYPSPAGGYRYPGAPGGYAAGAAVATTPDGQQLAGWWSRVGAYLIDLVVMTPLIAILAFPWIREIAGAYADMVREVLDAVRSGQAVPDQSGFAADNAGPLLALTLVSLLVNFVYNVGFLKWKAATPGKLLIGLRVRLREVPGPLGWGTVLRRWVGQNWYSPLSLVPVLGNLLVIYPFLDLLWPLWDSKKQALHDKIAATNVVRHSR
ncbi:RDD family protein [Nocardioides mesophilus]|uniref:RDD family protein n=1 Tax=Nocardioides mesophilus TaxID=433659 RepID=A0A7G9RD39_9ACTN|nr:RDD family protein [Nocardioides mesophilus]QNN53514.1 RDD family protein [Nocardioides mesophilus]